MGFKLRQPIKIDPVARYEVPFTPDNIPDNSGLVARANDNGNMIVNKNIPKNSKLRKIAESHEDNHLRDIMDGKLAYDENAVYHNMDGKGMKKTSRSEFDESDRTTPWEAPAYKAGEEMAQIDMRPKKNKLNRASEVSKGNFAFAFREINKPLRKQDQENVSSTEEFGTAMVKKFGKGFSFLTGEGDPVKGITDSDASGNKTSAKATEPEKGEWGPWTKDPNNPKREVRYRAGESKATSKPEYRVKAAISGGKAGAGYEATMIKMLEDGKTYEEIAEGGHGTVEGLRAKFEGRFTPPSTDKKIIKEEEQRFKEKDPIPGEEPGTDPGPKPNPCPPGYSKTTMRRYNLPGEPKKSNLIMVGDQPCVPPEGKKPKKSKTNDLDQNLSKIKGDTEVCNVDDTEKEKKRKDCGGYSQKDAKKASKKAARNISNSGIIKKSRK